MNIKPICNADFISRYQVVGGYITDVLTNKKITNNTSLLNDVIKTGMLNSHIVDYNACHKDKIRLLNIVV